MSEKVLISVALCTYNGERFLGEQLESLARQSRLPDELVVVDDGSTDGTVAVLENFARTSPFPVRIQLNQSTLGVTKNFEKALTQCLGELLFLCDQDDLWETEKIARMAAFLQQTPQVNVVFSDAFLVDEKAAFLPHRLWDAVQLQPAQLEQWRQGKSIKLMLLGNRVAGCTMALRKSFLDQLPPFPTDIPEFLHDTWIALVASVLNEIQFIDLPLVKYRQHPAQQVGTQRERPQALTLRKRLSRPHREKLAPLQKTHAELSKLYGYLQRIVPTDNENMRLIAEKICFLSMRSTLPDNRLLRLPPILKEWRKGNYYRFAEQNTTAKGVFLTALGDFLE
ncbi:MAG: glycosyltransferase family 2 protein [Spirosomataceae bacterium]